MPAIHLIERLNNISRIDRDRNEWESGYWVLSEETAQRLVGGGLYLHKGQFEPSHFGGTILGYRVQKGGDLDGRVIFRFQASMGHKGLKTDRDGWGNEKKVVV